MSADLGKTIQVGSDVTREAKAILRDIGRSMRRVKSKDTRDKAGLRVVWHQGKLRTDLSSWEDEAKDINRQEFSFFNQMVEFRTGQALRTGTVPNTPSDDANLTPRSALFVPHRDPDITVLEAASSILRACSKRDYFTQHLLKEVNRTLNESQKSFKRTQVLGLEVFQALDRVRVEEQKKKKTVNPTTYVSVGIVVVCVAVAVVLFFVLKHR